MQKVENGLLLIKPRNHDEIILIKSWRMFKEDRVKGVWFAELSKTMLEKVKKEVGLIPPAQTELDKFVEIQEAVDYVRVLPNDKIPNIVHFPIHGIPFAHQKRGALMALLTFGVISPDEVRKKK